MMPSSRPSCLHRRAIGSRSRPGGPGLPPLPRVPGCPGIVANQANDLLADRWVVHVPLLHAVFGCESSGLLDSMWLIPDSARLAAKALEQRASLPCRGHPRLLQQPVDCVVVPRIVVARIGVGRGRGRHWVVLLSRERLGILGRCSELPATLFEQISQERCRWISDASLNPTHCRHRAIGELR